MTFAVIGTVGEAGVLGDTGGLADRDGVAEVRQMAKNFLARSIPKRIMVVMDLLTLCLDGTTSILALRCRQSRGVHVIR